jgi:hypothetical protein
MRKKAEFNCLLILGIVFCICVGFVQAATSYNTPDIKVTLLNQDPDPVTNGDIVEVRFKIENEGIESKVNNIVKILPKFPFTLYGDVAEKDIGKLRAGQTGADAVIVSYKLKVDEDAVEGDMEIELMIKVAEGVWIPYTDDEFLIDVEAEEVNLQIGLLKTEPTKLIADTEAAELSVELQNLGDVDAENVKVNIEFPEGFTATYGYSDQDVLGTIEADSSETAKFYIDVDENLKEGLYLAVMSIQYKEENDEDNEYKKKNMTLNIPLKATPLFEITDVQTISEKIRAGDDVELRFKVKNIGTKDAESVSIRAFKESSQPFEFDEKSDYIGKLMPNDEGEAVLYFSIKNDAIAKTYMLDIEIRTINKEDVLLFEKTIPVKVSNHGAFSFARRISSEMLIFVVIVMLSVAGYFVWKKVKSKGNNRKGMMKKTKFLNKKRNSPHK